MALGIMCKDCGDILALQPDDETVRKFFASALDLAPTVKVDCPGRGKEHPAPPGFQVVE